MCFFYADLKSPQIDLPQGAGADYRIVVVAVIFLIVAGKVLGAGGYRSALQALYHRGGQLAGDQRVLGEIFKIAPAQRIAVDIHARRQQHIGALVYHLPPHGGVQVLYQRQVPAASQGGAAGQQGAGGPQANPGGAVSGDHRGYALLPQAFADPGHGARIAGGTQWAVHHALAATEQLHLCGRQLRHKVVQADAALGHICQHKALVAGDRQGRGQIIQDLLL